MDGRRIDAVTDESLDREIHALLAAEPSPEFVARVRARVAQEPQPGRWRAALMLAVPTAVAGIVVLAMLWPSSELLPADTQLWKDRDAGVPNALMDDEFGDALDAIRAKGAFIWFVIDACHSGTATRNVILDTAEAVDRELKPDDLGIPAEEIVSRRPRSSAMRTESWA